MRKDNELVASVHKRLPGNNVWLDACRLANRFCCRFLWCRASWTEVDHRLVDLNPIWKGFSGWILLDPFLDDFLGVRQELDFRNSTNVHLALFKRIRDGYYSILSSIVSWKVEQVVSRTNSVRKIWNNPVQSTVKQIRINCENSSNRV